MNIGQIKENGKRAFRANYWRCVFVAFLMGLLTAGATTSTGNSARNANDAQVGQTLIDSLNGLSDSDRAIFLGAFFGSLSIIAIVAFLLRVFLFNPLEVGGYRFFRKNLEGEDVGIGVLKEGFGDYGHTFITLFLRDIFGILWTLLFIIPGFVKTYSYWLVPYLIKDNPDLSATETITRSRDMMNGHKWEAFVMDLSFLGWYILGFLTLGLVDVFWTEPYHESAKAEFYLELLLERQ